MTRRKVVQEEPAAVAPAWLNWRRVLRGLALILAVVILIAWGVPMPLPPRTEVWEWLVAVLYIASTL